MSKKRLPKSIRKFLRREKARIRSRVLDLKKQKELIDELYAKFLGSYSIKKDNFSKKRKEPKGAEKAKKEKEKEKEKREKKKTEEKTSLENKK